MADRPFNGLLSPLGFLLCLSLDLLFVASMEGIIRVLMLFFEGSDYNKDMKEIKLSLEEAVDQFARLRRYL